MRTRIQPYFFSALREELGLTGTKYGCGEGQCGACTVLLNGTPRRSCQLSVTDVAGKSILTIEGFEQNGQLHPVQQAFLDQGAFQCAYCTSGMIVSSVALLQKNLNPNEQEIVQALQGNICPLRHPSQNRRRRSAGRQSHAWSEIMTAGAALPFGPEPERYELRSSSFHHFNLQRRDFFKIMGAGIAIFTVAANASAAQESGNRRHNADQEQPKDISSWLHINDAGMVTVFTGKVEVGQNTRTTLAQSVADELRVPACQRSHGHGRYRAYAF